MGSNSCQWGFGNKAQVCGSWSRDFGFRLELLPNLMQVKLLLTKTQSFAVSLIHTTNQCEWLLIIKSRDNTLLPSCGISCFRSTLKVMTSIPKTVE